MAKVSIWRDGKVMRVNEAALERPDLSPLPTLPKRLSKATLWRRATDEEAEILDATLAAMPARMRRIFDGAGYLDHADDYFPDLRAGIAAALNSEERADELLEPEA